MMVESAEAARRAYAEELRFIARLRSPAVLAAFATVPRERFVGPGPWRIKSPWGLEEYWTTDDADLRSVYHDVLIALDEAQGINNGQPSLWAFLFDKFSVAANEHALHLGCGTGYYTAIMAELVGSKGKITAVAYRRLAELVSGGTMYAANAKKRASLRHIANFLSLKPGGVFERRPTSRRGDKPQ
jgi:protein-L-isoaspartate(D-aspartate) O-methyltransferase